jgi:hypothetical protein
VLAESKQKGIDIKKEKIVAHDIIVAKLANNEWKKYIGKASYDVMWDWNIATGQMYAGDSIEELFGYTLQKNIMPVTDLRQYLLPEEKEAVEKKLKETLASAAKSW